MLTRLAVWWSSTLTGSRLGALTQESGDRFFFLFTHERGEVGLTICLDPRDPWIGERVQRWQGPRWSPDPFTVQVSHALVGRRLERVEKDPADRSIRFDVGHGRGLAIELAPPRTNMVLLGEHGSIQGSLHRPKKAGERLDPGRAWVSRGFPAGTIDPFRADPGAVDAVVALAVTGGDSIADALRRRTVGVGPVGAELVVQEHIATGRSIGIVLQERLAEILTGVSEVGVESPDDPSGIPDGGAFDTTEWRLLPWRPFSVRPGCRLFVHDDPARSAALFHEARAGAARLRLRIAALLGILQRELQRTRDAEVKVREGLRSFADPERYRLMGEALLASLTSARRSGDLTFVPDPYDPEGREIAIPAAAGKPLARVADELFGKYRRSKRGLAAAGSRAEALSLRASRLEELLASHGRITNEPEASALEHDMRGEGLPVGLVGPTRAARSQARHAIPRLEGVRMLTSADGWTILVGRTGRDNDRLTFKIAAPDDIWLHAAGVPGAHVVIRNPERRASVPAATIEEAAQWALWFSDARSEAGGEVHWTRRKYVRRARGGAPGKVALKRHETVRVRARRPPEGA